jgi:hypothetical protein
MISVLIITKSLVIIVPKLKNSCSNKLILRLLICQRLVLEGKRTSGDMDEYIRLLTSVVSLFDLIRILK